RVDPRNLPAPAQVREAGNLLLPRDAGDGLRGPAPRDRRLPRVAPEVDVDIPTLIVREEADDVAPVGLDGESVPPLPAELRVEGVRHPARAVDGCVDPVGEALPAGLPRRRAGAR